MFEGVEVSDILKERVLRGSFRRQTSLWFVRFSLVSPSQFVLTVYVMFSHCEVSNEAE